MPEDSLLIRVLEKLGFNTTKLRWRLYQMEKTAARTKQNKGVPESLHWMRYQHKICGHCGGVNDREAKVCHRCERKLPGVMGYRVRRLVSTLVPAGAPAVSYGFLAVMVAVFGVQLLLGSLLVSPFQALMAPPTAVTYVLGSYSNDLANGLAYWRVLAFGLVHFGIIHIGFNGFALTQIGPIVEQALGRRRMLVLITACQIAAAMASLLWYEHYQHRAFVTVGASGWVFGLIGFGAMYFHRLGDHGRVYRDVLLRWVAYAVVFGIIIGANNAAHIGGLLAGALLAGFPGGRGLSPDERDPVWSVAFWICLVLWIGTLGMMGYSLAVNFDDVLAMRR